MGETKMRINEIPKFKEMFPDDNDIKINAFAGERRLLEFYAKGVSINDEKVVGEVVAYRQSFMGLVFLFKGKIDFFAFSIVDCPLNRYSWNRVLHRLNLGAVKKAFEDNKGKEDLVIVDEDLYKKFNASIVLKGLESR